MKREEVKKRREGGEKEEKKERRGEKGEKEERKREKNLLTSIQTRKVIFCNNTVWRGGKRGRS